MPSNDIALKSYRLSRISLFIFIALSIAWLILSGVGTGGGASFALLYPFAGFAIASLFNLLPLKSHHAISSIMPLPENEEQWKKLYVVFATANGKVRKNSLEDFSNIQSTGKIAMKLDEGDKIIGVKICKEDQDIILSTHLGKCIIFMSKKLRIFKGRSSKGIKGIELGLSLIHISENKRRYDI